jgi:hypothetical protein
MLFRFVCLFALAFTLWADVSGKWSAKVPREGATTSVIFEFRTEGATLTGTVNSDQGGADIVEGKVSGEDVSFIIRTDNARFIVKGKLQGSEIRFRAQRDGSDRVVEFTATKAE